MSKQELTVLSFGAGQDSSFILYMIITFKWFREKYVKGRLIVVFSDTGDEFNHTYEHILYIQRLCKENNIEFYFLSKSPYHPRTWKSLTAQFERNQNIMSMTGSRSCTDNLKIKVIYNFLDHYIAQEYYGYRGSKIPKGKHYIKKFAEDQGKIRVIIGIAYGEEKRVMKASKKQLKKMQRVFDKKWSHPIPLWFRMGIEKCYCLIDEAIARWDIHDRTEAMGFQLPFPSNCKKCPYITKQELLWLYRFMPLDYYLWVFYEKKKMVKWECKGDKNHGVKGEGKTLEDILEEAIKEFGHWTDEQLTEYKMSHGHCVMSTY
ncbi:hypothetical protein AAW12_08835 [Sphingobacterium sp. Ag1]|uniref:hypothetical protein n=1 Tax=Sphingobacterium sp. Ag1 TaxID=1643451 RepID=UPI0006275EF1|nr:hypothetical protein [Sphingobacterium sp. Ag1]KKO91756.1 hypothetical protein AAW12_08835 [Sphingobacterium sp. Ag1]